MSTSTAVAPTHARDTVTPALLLGVLGIVYGDIGTSPLYALSTCLTFFGKAGMTEDTVLGILSMIFWSLILVVTVKYVTFVMRADNHGEGGILTMMVLAQRVTRRPKVASAVAMIAIIGACLFFGDGMITPAISVLSAVEGLEVTAPIFKPAVLPLSVLVIGLLFAFQYRGTATIGRIFGPVMAVFFLTIGLLGVTQIVHNPSVLRALSPSYIVIFAAHHGLVTFVTLGSVVLAVTGAEALYADMGHFGRRPIQRSWTFFVLPCLVLNYFGQGALILRDPDALDNPFFLLAPLWLRLPLVILATAATVIASQAMISGAYSVARQCVQLGFIPRMIVRHTSETEEGQIYLPQVNTIILIGVLLLVLSFRSSAALASAYGVAVTGTFTCTTLLSALVFRRQFKWSRAATLCVFGSLLILDLLFFTSNLLKVPEGGWVPLAVGLVLMAIMTSWKRGRELMLQRWKQDSLPLNSFLARLPASRIIRVPGTAVFLTGNGAYVPNALLHNLKHNKVLHERVFLVTVQTADVPEVPEAERVEVEELAPQVNRVTVRYGFKESPNIPRALEEMRVVGVPFDPMQTSYFLGREVIVPALVPKLPFWRLWIFLVLSRNAVAATEFFRIPSDRVVELGVRIAI
ncbi:potassium transporter Kup [Acidisoma cladoniae]|jgi:KUP system potassium uptake protein|uniref:potassium transporter Kup n=1 Tax=Acidisoma cladoniae TaxID=3040935 RepID=UPI00254A02A1|nr:potassium transporter Kup [Acidisoma sp. PAMC 29798]